MLPVYKFIIIFTLIIIMLRKKIDLGATLLTATFVLGLIFGLSFLTTLHRVAFSLQESTTVTLIIALILILILESIMRQTGMLKALTDSLSRLPWNHCLTIAALPAIVGLLPSAGGARFSAPLVAQATDGRPFTNPEKVFINYWFRHIWEYSLPLYPGLILAAAISGIPLGDIIIRLWPMSVLWALIGYKFAFQKYRRRIAGEIDPHDTRVRSPVGHVLKTFLVSAWPLLTTVALVLGHVPITWALGLVLLTMIWLKKYPWRHIIHTLMEPMTRRIFFLIWGVMAFKTVLQHTGAAEQLSNTIATYNIPTVLVATILPVSIGLLTGLVQACTGVTFSMLMGLVEPTAAYVMLVYSAGVIGVMLSPVHLCFILTVEYFETDFFTAYTKLILPSLLVFIILQAFYGLLAYGF